MYIAYRNSNITLLIPPTRKILGRHQHITLEEAHKALDSSATKKHPDTGLPTRILPRGTKRA